MSAAGTIPTRPAVRRVMAGRSIRTRIKFQVQKATEDLDRALGHLQSLDEFQGGESDYIETELPKVVNIVAIAQEALSVFREGI